MDLKDIDTRCPLCGAKDDDQQHIIYACAHRTIAECRRQWDTHISRKVDAAAQ